MRFTVAALFLLVLAPVICAQQAAPVTVKAVPSARVDGSLEEFASAPPDIVLISKGERARSGRLWIRNAGNGLLIAGDVEGGRPDFPSDKTSLFVGDHVEVWLAADIDPVLPPVGWGNQFGENTLAKGAGSCGGYLKEAGAPLDDSPESVQKCREWAMQQDKYRRYFQRLFLRQWLLAPGYAVEAFAAPAHEEIVSRFASDEITKALNPRGVPEFRYTASPKGYTFRVLIPYGAFPPLPSLELREVRLLVDVFSAAPGGKKMGAFSSSSPGRVWGNPGTFNKLDFNSPQVFHMTPCDLPLQGKDIYGNVRDAWFIPKQEGEYESDVFLVVNGAAGYRYQPEGFSPVIRPVHDFWISVGPGEWICGPQLAHKKGNSRVVFKRRVAEEGLATHTLPNGDLLVKEGPLVGYSEFGAGQCGGCPWTDLTVYHLTPDNKITEALKLGDVIADMGQSPQDEDFSISPDWSQIVQYKQEPDDEKGNPGSWSSTTYCLKGTRYEACGRKEGVEPPNPPVLKGLR